MAKYRPLAPLAPTTARTTTPHHTHVTWDLTCARCTDQMNQRAASMTAQRLAMVSRTLRTAPGYAR